MKKQHIIIIIVVLAAMVGILSFVNRPQESIEKGILSITKDGETIKKFNMEDIKSLPKVEERIKFSSSNYAGEDAMYTGVPLRELLNSIDPKLLENATQVITKAEDGFVSSFTAKEVAESDSVIIAYAKNGKSLGTKQNNGEGPYRVVIKTDAFGNRSTKYLNEIELK